VSFVLSFLSKLFIYSGVEEDSLLFRIPWDQSRRRHSGWSSIKP
jgi:hypothetical protein